MSKNIEQFIEEDWDEIGMEGFFNIVWYNGYRDEINKWIGTLGDDAAEQRYPQCPLSIMPKDHLEAYAFGQMEALWMMLVAWFGDYGTSPRRGWITDWDGCKDFLKKVVALCDEYESYNKEG